MNWLRGYVRCDMRTTSQERFLNLCRHHGIRLWKVCKKDDGLIFCIRAKDYKRLHKICAKIHATPKIQKKKGLPFWNLLARKRWGFVLGILVFLLALYYLSGFVWKLEVVGQSKYTKETIEKALDEFGVKEHMRRSQIDGKAIEDYIRKKYNEISWVSAEEIGCLLRIKIKEGKDVVASQKEEKPCHIVASCDGIIESIVTAKGTPKVKKGSKVKKGDVLIFGGVNVLDDAKEVTEIIPVAAEGTIKIRCKQKERVEFPYETREKKYTGKCYEVTAVTIGNKRFFLKNPLKRFDKSSKYDIITKVCFDKPPLHVVRRSAYEYQYVKVRRTKEQIRGLMKNAFADRIIELEAKGYDILEREAHMFSEKRSLVLQVEMVVLVPQIEKRGMKSSEWSVKKPDGEDGKNS